MQSELNELLSLYRQMTEAQKQELIDAMKDLLKDQNKKTED